MNRIRIALSGGGHRATVFSLGALLYLVDAKRMGDVQTITSVSGGSITNAYLSLFDKPLSKLSRDDIAAFARQIAGRPDVWWLSWILYLLVLVGVWLWPAPHLGIPLFAQILIFAVFLRLAAVLVGKHSGGTLWAWWGTWVFIGILPPVLLLSTWILPSVQPLGLIERRVLGFLAMLLIWATVMGPRSPSALWCWWGTWGYVGVLLLVAFVVPGKWLLGPGYWPVLGIGLVLLAISQRHVVAGLAFGATVRTPSATARRRLCKMQSTGVRHIFCATELHVGRHLFFSSDFVFAKDFGLGVPGPFRVRDAVQASANFPGGFPFRTYRAKIFGFAPLLQQTRERTTVVLTDGGVYDNTATAWYRDSAEIAIDIRLQAQLSTCAKRAQAERATIEAMVEGVLADADERRRVLRELRSDESLKLDVAPTVLSVGPETVQALLTELHDSSYDLIAINAAYPPAIHNASFVSLPVLSDLLVFTKTTGTLYNNDNYQRLRSLRGEFLGGRSGALVLS